ncbi:hypothetical protein CKO12_04165 [Chromatium okenii]|nr:hypothetical protein [Chromatium okenii]
MTVPIRAKLALNCSVVKLGASAPIMPLEIACETPKIASTITPPIMTLVLPILLKAAGIKPGVTSLIEVDPIVRTSNKQQG